MRKTAVCIVLALLAALGCAGASGEGGPFVLPLETDVLVDGDGALLTQTGAYDFIVPLPGGVFAGLQSDSAFLLDADGTALDGPYENIYAQDDLICVVQEGLTGVLGDDLALRIPCTHTQIVSNGNGAFLAINSDPYDERPDGVYFVSEDGEETATGARIQYGLCPFSEGLMPAMDAVAGRMGYLNEKGEWAISAQYDYAGDFRDGAAEAALPAGTGLIDRKGNWLLTPKYWAVGRSGGEDRIVLAQKSGEVIELLDAVTYETVKEITGSDICFFADLDCNAAALYLDDCTRLIGPGGETLVECGLDATFDVWSETNDRVLVRLGDWGEECVWLYDLAGNAVAGPWQDAWLLGETEKGTLYAAGAFEADDEALPENRIVSIVDQDGEAVAGGMLLTAASMDASGHIILEAPDGAGAMNADGTFLCWYDRTGNAAEPPLIR